jgi:cell wall-associated NlpC family hydrolase
MIPREIMTRRYERGVFDCWDMVREVQRLMFQREVPDFNLRGMRGLARALTWDLEAAFGWTGTNSPKTGDIVLIAAGDCAAPHHVGVFFADPPRVLHCDMDCQVALDDLDQLALRRFRIFEVLTPA